MKYPHVHSMGDAGEILFGPVGRILLEIGQLLLLLFVMSSHILTATIVLSTITERAVCGIVFGVVALVICFLGSLPRTMARVYWLSLFCEFPPAVQIIQCCPTIGYDVKSLFLTLFCLSAFASIFATTIITMISIAVQSTGNVQVEAVRDVSFYEGFLAFTNIMFGFSKLDNASPTLTLNLPANPSPSCSCYLLWAHLRNTRP